MLLGTTKISACAALLLVLAGCGGGNGGATRPAGAKIIGPEGGTVEVSDPESPLAGTRLSIPAGALAQTAGITISPAALPADMPGNSLPASSSAVRFGPPGLAFRKPVTITLGYADANQDRLVDGTGRSESGVGVLYTSGKNRRIFIPLARDPARNTVTFQTTHFSTYLSYVGDPVVGSDSGSDDAPVTTEFLPGEHFRSAPTYTYDQEGNPVPAHSKSPYYDITVLRSNTLLAAWLNPEQTLLAAGIPCPLAEDFRSCTFDAAALFPKVAASGDTALWDWQCEFVAGHTYLKNHVVDDDALRPEKAGTGIYCQMEAVAAEPAKVQVNWGINVNEEVYYISPASGGGHRLAVRFRANYLGR